MKLGEIDRDSNWTGQPHGLPMATGTNCLWIDHNRSAIEKDYTTLYIGWFYVLPACLQKCIAVSMIDR